MFLELASNSRSPIFATQTALEALLAEDSPADSRPLAKPVMLAD
jgi:hypothetical protein